MKKLILIILLLLLANILFSFNINEIETGACEGFHMTGAAGIYIISDLVTEWLKLPSYCPVLLVSSVCIGKELFDANFSLNDLKWDCIGIGIGFSIRLIDRSNK